MTSIENRAEAGTRTFARLDYIAASPSGPHLHVTLRGDVDLGVAGLLEDTLEKVTAMPPCGITVDLAEVTFLCSTGLNFIAAAHRHAAGHGYAVTVANPAPIVRRVLQICGFDRVMTVTG